MRAVLYCPQCRCLGTLRGPGAGRLGGRAWLLATECPAMSFQGQGGRLAFPLVDSQKAVAERRDAVRGRGHAHVQQFSRRLRVSLAGAKHQLPAGDRTAAGHGSVVLRRRTAVDRQPSPPPQRLCDHRSESARLAGRIPGRVAEGRRDVARIRGNAASLTIPSRQMASRLSANCPNGRRSPRSAKAWIRSPN